MNRKRIFLIVAGLAIVIGFMTIIRIYKNNAEENRISDALLLETNLDVIGDSVEEKEGEVSDSDVNDNNLNVNENKEEQGEKTQEDNNTNEVSNTKNESNNSEGIDYYWYKTNNKFEQDNKEHTFSMEWIDDICLEFIFDSQMVVSSCENVKGEVQGDTIVYKGTDDIQVIYFYKEGKIQVVDNTNNEINYSGIYNRK